LLIKDCQILGMIMTINLISDSLKVELKQLINEVLDEREHQKKLEGPYDFPEDESDEWLYRGTY